MELECVVCIETRFRGLFIEFVYNNIKCWHFAGTNRSVYQLTVYTAEHNILPMDMYVG